MNEIITRAATFADVDVKQRMIDMIAVPWDEETDVVWRGEMWREVMRRGAFDGLEPHAGRIPLNRQHVEGDTVGKAVKFENASVGLLCRAKVAQTPRGDETLQLAMEDMLSPSVGYYVKSLSDVRINKRMKLREVVRAFMQHMSLVETPAFPGAQVLAVREAPSGLAVAETSPLPDTPALDAAMNDDVFAWAAARLAARAE